MFIAAIKCLLNLVSHGKSAHSIYLADEFTCIAERQGELKHISLYQDRRLTKLGYVYVVLKDALPLIQEPLSETNHYNKHLEAARL